MRDNIIKRGDKWAFVMELLRDPATGKRRQKWFSGYDTRKEAVAARNAIRAEIATDTFVERSRQTVHEFLDDWLEAVEPTLSPSTFHSYERNLRLHVKPRIGALRLPELDAGMINQLYAEAPCRGKPRPTGRPQGPDRALHPHDPASSVQGRRPMGSTPRQPCRSGRSSRHNGRCLPRDGHLGRRDPGVVLERARTTNDRYYAAWYLTATTGLRRGEALGLRWADLNLQTGRASIRQTLVCVNHEVQISSPKTTNSRRAIALDQGTIAVILGHRDAQAARKADVGDAWPDHDLILTLTDGRPIHPERFSREFDRRIKRWGLPRIRLHDLRHTWATLALQAGVHPKVVSERLGHANISITLDTYSHVTPAMQEDAAETVAEFIRLETERGPGA